MGRTAKTGAAKLRAIWKLRLTTAVAAVLLGSPSGHAQSDLPDILSGTLARIKKTGTVRLGYREASIPFSFLDRSGRPVGYSMDICAAIVEEIGRVIDREDIKTAFVKVTSDNRLDAVVDGTIDLECGSTTANQERSRIVAFSPMIFVSGTKVMIPATLPWRDFRDLKGRTVIVTRGTTNQQALRVLDEKFKLGIRLVESPDHEESFRMLADGQGDAFATDDVLLYGLIARHKAQGQFRVAGEFLSYDPYGIVFRRGEPEMRAAVERAIRRLVVERDIGPLYSRWFEQRLPGGERLNIPMNPQLSQSLDAIGAADGPN